MSDGSGLNFAVKIYLLIFFEWLFPSLFCCHDSKNGQDLMSESINKLKNTNVSSLTYFIVVYRSPELKRYDQHSGPPPSGFFGEVLITETYKVPIGFNCTDSFWPLTCKKIQIGQRL